MGSLAQVMHIDRKNFTRNRNVRHITRASTTFQSPFSAGMIVYEIGTVTMAINSICQWQISSNRWHTNTAQSAKWHKSFSSWYDYPNKVNDMNWSQQSGKEIATKSSSQCHRSHCILREANKIPFQRSTKVGDICLM